MRIRSVAVGFASILALLAALVVASPAQALSASISGAVTVVGAMPGTLGGIRVDVFTQHGINPVTTTYTSSDGTYSIGAGIPAGNWLIVRFSGSHDGTPLATQWFDGAFTRSDATVFEPLYDGQAVTGVDALMDYAGAIHGSVTAETGDPLYVFLFCYRVDDVTDELTLQTLVTVGGAYELPDLAPGRYILRTRSPNAPPWPFNALYWASGGGVRYLEDAEEIVVEPGTTIEDADIALPLRSFDVARIGGSDRYATAVQVTQAMFPDPGPEDPPLSVPVVYVASGTNFPDALAAGPAAMQGGGAVLLTPRDSLPAGVAAELDRLNPERIVVAGSTGAIGPGVFATLQQYVPSPSGLDRIGGVDRYATARLLIADAFDAGSAPSLIVASGRNFPDALGAGPPVGRVGAPVLLIDGLDPASPDTAKDLLDYLGTRSVLLAGGESVITNATAQSLEGVLESLDPSPDYHVNRQSFVSDRYATAVAVNEWFAYRSDIAILSSGLGFADAMSGGPLTHLVGGPIYLTGPDCIPQATADALAKNDIQLVILLGGPAVLRDGVESLTLC